MGYNTTVVILTDALHHIAADQEFGMNLARAINRCAFDGKPVDIPSGGYANAARVISTNHADQMRMVLVGGNTGEDIGYVGTWRLDVKHNEVHKKNFVKRVAEMLGFKVAIRKQACCPGGLK